MTGNNYFDELSSPAYNTLKNEVVYEVLSNVNSALHNPIKLMEFILFALCFNKAMRMITDNVTEITEKDIDSVYNDFEPTMREELQPALSLKLHIPDDDSLEESFRVINELVGSDYYHQRTTDPLNYDAIKAMTESNRSTVLECLKNRIYDNDPATIYNMIIYSEALYYAANSLMDKNCTYISIQVIKMYSAEIKYSIALDSLEQWKKNRDFEQ